MGTKLYDRAYTIEYLLKISFSFPHKWKYIYSKHDATIPLSGNPCVAFYSLQCYYIHEMTKSHSSKNEFP